MAITQLTSTITALPAAPSRQDPDNFSTRADDFLEALSGASPNEATTGLDYELAGLISELQTMITEQNQLYTNIAGLQNYQGAWSAGTYSLGDSVSHLGVIWVCEGDPTTTGTPGSSADWVSTGFAAGYDGNLSTFTLAADTEISMYARTFLNDTTQLQVQTTLGVVPGTDVQVYNANLTTYAGTAPSANGLALINTTYSSMRSLLDLVVGTDVQGFSNRLAAYDTVTPSSDGLNVVSANTYADIRSLLNVENGADVTDTTNVTAAGAVMNTDVDADIKTLTLPASTTISTLGKSLIGGTTDSGMRGTLGAQATITGAASTITSSDLTAYRALVSTSSGKVAASSTITTTELELLNGHSSGLIGVNSAGLMNVALRCNYADYGSASNISPNFNLENIGIWTAPTTSQTLGAPINRSGCQVMHLRVRNGTGAGTTMNFNAIYDVIGNYDTTFDVYNYLTLVSFGTTGQIALYIAQES